MELVLQQTKVFADKWAEAARVVWVSPSRSSRDGPAPARVPAVEGLDADVDLDGWLAAMWAAFQPAKTVLGPAVVSEGPALAGPVVS